MAEIRYTCLYCNHKWTYISYYASKDTSSRCQKCKETKLIKAEVVKESDKKGNVFGYEEDEPKKEDDDYRD